MEIADAASTRLNRHHWSTVVTAGLNRYPNPINPGVVACDVIDRTLSTSGLLHSHRLLTANWGFAPALRAFFKMIDYRCPSMSNDRSNEKLSSQPFYPH